MNQLQTDKCGEQIDHLIDEMGVSNLLNLIALVCREKAQHIRNEWQDPNAALNWDDTANKLDRLATKV